MAGAPPLVGGVRTEGCGPSAATTQGRTAAVPGGMCWGRVGRGRKRGGVRGFRWGEWGGGDSRVARWPARAAGLAWGAEAAAAGRGWGGGDGLWAGPAGPGRGVQLRGFGA